MPKKYFHDDDVIDDVTGWPQSRPGHKVSQILKLIYLRQYLSYNVDQKLKMSEMPMAIFLVYSPSGVTSGKKVCRELEMAAILKILKY